MYWKLCACPNYFAKELINKNLFWYKDKQILAQKYSVPSIGEWKGQMFTLVQAICIKSKHDDLLAAINSCYQNIYRTLYLP